MSSISLNCTEVRTIKACRLEKIKQYYKIPVSLIDTMDAFAVGVYVGCLRFSTVFNEVNTSMRQLDNWYHASITKGPQKSAMYKRIRQGFVTIAKKGFIDASVEDMKKLSYSDNLRIPFCKNRGWAPGYSYATVRFEFDEIEKLNDICGEQHWRDNRCSVYVLFVAALLRAKMQRQDNSTRGMVELPASIMDFDELARAMGRLTRTTWDLCKEVEESGLGVCETYNLEFDPMSEYAQMLRKPLPDKRLIVYYRRKEDHDKAFIAVRDQLLDLFPGYAMPGIKMRRPQQYEEAEEIQRGIYPQP